MDNKLCKIDSPIFSGDIYPTENKGIVMSIRPKIDNFDRTDLMKCATICINAIYGHYYENDPFKVERIDLC